MWPWADTINYEAEYKRSLQNLQHFIKAVDVSTLYSLEDVSAMVSLVGHDLHILAITQGKQMEKARKYLVSWSPEPSGESGSEYVYTVTFEDREVVVTASEGLSVIVAHRTIGFQRYQREELRVKLPSDRDIAFGNTPNVNDQSLYAIDLRGGSNKEYHPIKEPENAEVQQRFVALLKEAMQDVFHVVA